MSDLWQIPRPARSDDHPTMKPVELVVRAVEGAPRVLWPQEERATDIEDQQQREAKQPTEGPQVVRGRGLRFLGSRWFPWASWGVSALALGYVASRLRLSELRTNLSGISWWLVIVAVLLQIVPRLLESLRWQYLLRPLPLLLRHLFQAVYVGTLFSGILPPFRRRCGARGDDRASSPSPGDAGPFQRASRACR